MTARGRVVVVSPHLDDAVLSAWLVLDRAEHARVVSCFAGIPGPGVQGSWDAGQEGASAVAARRAEDERALARTGSEPVHLDLPDAQYRTAQDERLVVDELTALLRAQLVSADEVWVPAGLGDHVDHLATRHSALAASSPGQRRYLYADLPYAGQPAWPGEVTGRLRDRVAHATGSALGVPTAATRWSTTLAAVPEASPESMRVLLLTPSQRREKLRAVAEYRSQLRSLRCGRRNVLRRRRLFAYEVCWPLPTDAASR